MHNLFTMDMTIIFTAPNVFIIQRLLCYVYIWLASYSYLCIFLSRLVPMALFLLAGPTILDTLIVSRLVGRGPGMPMWRLHSGMLLTSEQMAISTTLCWSPIIITMIMIPITRSILSTWMLISAWDNVPVYPHYYVLNYGRYYNDRFRENILTNVGGNALTLVVYVAR